MNPNFLLCGAIFANLVQGQYGSVTISPYAAVATTPVYPSGGDGLFLWPAGAGATDFTEGSLMNVSWTTVWPTVNLWLIVNEDWEKPYSIALLKANFAGNSIEWKVACGSTCNVPFLFRAVDAQGSDSSQQHGGFYTRLFWITPTGGSSTRSTLSPSYATADLVPSISSQTPSSQATSNKASSNQVSSSQTFSQPTASQSSISAIPSSRQPNSSVSHHDVVIGVGVGVGGGIGIMLFLIGALLLWRRYHRRMKEKYSRPQSPVLTSSSGTLYEQGYFKTRAGPLKQQDVEPVEAYAKEMSFPVEAPPWQSSPKELPGSGSEF